MDRRGESEGYLHFESKQSLLDRIGCTRSNIFFLCSNKETIGWNARGTRYPRWDAERLKSGTKGSERVSSYLPYGYITIPKGVR